MMILSALERKREKFHVSLMAICRIHTFFPCPTCFAKIQKNARDCDSSTILEADQTFTFKNV